VLTVGAFLASSLSSAVIWIPLAIVAFLVLWLPAFFGVDTRCPHCRRPFFGEQKDATGSWPATFWTFFRVQSCRHCLIRLGTPADAAASAVKLANELEAERIAGSWRCACETMNAKERSTCRRCWAARPAP